MNNWYIRCTQQQNLTRFTWNIQNSRW
jgi:hypothetical protein